MQVLATESLSDFQEKFHFESFEEFVVTPIKDGGCGFETPAYGKRMISAFLYGDYIRSLLPSPHAERLFDLPYDKLERIKSVENYLMKEDKGGFEKNADTLKDITTMALTLATIPFRENIRDIRNGQLHKIEPEPLSNIQRRALAWDHLYTHVLNKSKNTEAGESQISFKNLLTDMQIILYKIK